MTLEDILKLIYSSQRAIVAHHNSWRGRTQSFGIDTPLINPDEDYNLASATFYSQDLFMDNIEKLGIAFIGYFLKIGEDSTLAGFLATKTESLLNASDVIEILLRKNIEMWQNDIDSTIIGHLISNEAKADYMEYYKLGVDYAKKSI